jgi:hypothetical protein
MSTFKVFDSSFSCFRVFEIALALSAGIFVDATKIRKDLQLFMHSLLKTNPKALVEFYHVVVNASATKETVVRHVRRLSNFSHHSGIFEIFFLSLMFQCRTVCTILPENVAVDTIHKLRNFFSLNLPKFTVKMSMQCAANFSADNVSYTSFTLTHHGKPVLSSPKNSSLSCFNLILFQIKKMLCANPPTNRFWVKLLVGHRNKLKRERQKIFNIKRNRPNDSFFDPLTNSVKKRRTLSVEDKKEVSQAQASDEQKKFESAAKRHMKQWRKEMSSMKNYVCYVCSERTIRLKPLPFGQCERCAKDPGEVKKISAANNMIPCPVPHELSNMKPLEEMMIARHVPLLHCYYKRGGQRGFSGNCIAMPQDTKEFAKKLPVNVCRLPLVYIRKFGRDDFYRDFVVRREKIWKALLWLKKSNPHYFDIEIDVPYLLTLPLAGVPQGIKSISSDSVVKCPVCELLSSCSSCANCSICTTCPTCSFCQTCSKCRCSVAFGEEKFDANKSAEQLAIDEQDDQTSSFLLSEPNQPLQEHLLQRLINSDGTVGQLGSRKNPIDSHIGNTPANEFHEYGLISKCFPSLCPNGASDFTDVDRQIPVSLAEVVEHLIRYVDLHEDGSFTQRFATHPTFSFWIFNMWMRHSLLTQTNVYAKKHSHVANLTLGELRDQLKSGRNSAVFKGLHVYQANFPGTNGFWYRETHNLLSAVEQLPMPTFFWTISFADCQSNELQRFMPWAKNTVLQDLTYKQKKDKVIKNP